MLVVKDIAVEALVSSMKQTDFAYRLVLALMVLLKNYSQMMQSF